MEEQKLINQLVRKRGLYGIDVFSVDNPKNQNYRTIYQREYYKKVQKNQIKEKQKNIKIECKCGLSHDDTIESKKEHRRTKEHRFFKKHGYPKSEWKSKQQDRSEKVTCECLCEIQKWNLAKHMKTKRHFKLLEQKLEAEN